MVLIAAEVGNIGTRNSSQELFKETLLTLPVDVQHGEVSLAYHGIPLGGEKYLSACSQAGVIPFSRVKLEYDRNLGFYAPIGGVSNPSFLAISGRHSEESRRAAINGLFSGGKVHLIEAEIEFDRWEEFGDTLERAFGAEYSVRECDLWLSTYRLTGYNEGTYREGGLYIRRGGLSSGKKQLEFEFGESMDSGDREKVVGWFRDLAERHGVSVYENED